MEYRSEVHGSDTYAREINEEFELYWDSKFAIPYEEFIPWYKPPDGFVQNVLPQRSVAEQFKQVDFTYFRT